MAVPRNSFRLNGRARSRRRLDGELTSAAVC